MDFLMSEDAIRWFQQLVGPNRTAPFRVLSLLGDTWGILLAAGVALWRYGRGAGVAVAVAGVLAAPLWFALATVFAVERPAGAGIVVYEQVDAGAFPSGHVFHAVIVWGVLGGLTSFPAALALLVGVAAGIGRLYLGVHYPGDLLASLVLAPFVVWAFVALWRRVDLGASRWPATVWITVSLVMAAAVLLLVAGPVDPAGVRRWEVLGTVVGGPIALGLLYRWAPADRQVEGFGRLLAAILGLVVLTLGSRVFGSGLPWVGALTTATGLVWIFAGAPALLGEDGGPGP